MRLTQPWTEWEIALLKAQWDTHVKEELLALFPGRPWNSLLRAAERMGLKHRSLMVSYRATKPILLTTTEAAYIAGIVDGEGWIGMCITKRTKGFGLDPFLGITNTNLPLMEFLSTKFGTPIKGRTLTLGTKSKQLVRLGNAHKIADILRQIMPFMIVKRRQAELILGHCERRLNLPYRAPYGEEDLRVYQELKAMNQYARIQLRSTGNTDLRLSTIFRQNQETSSQTAS